MSNAVAEPVDDYSNLVRELQDQWVLNHPDVQKATTTLEAARQVVKNQQWTEDPSDFVHSVYNARSTLRIAAADLQIAREKVTALYQAGTK